MADVRHSQLGYFVLRSARLPALLSAILSLRKCLIIFLKKIYCFVFEHFQSKMSMRAEERGVYMINISRMFRKPWVTKNYSVSSIELVLLPAVCLFNSLSGTE